MLFGLDPLGYNALGAPLSARYYSVFSALQVTVPTLEFAGTGSVTTAGYLVVEASPVGFAGTSLADTAGRLVALSPALRLASEVFVRFPSSAEYPDSFAYTLNAETQAVTTYENFNPLELATYRGRTVGLFPSGLYQLSGDTDSGFPINAVLRTGDIDFGTLAEKSIPRAYLYVRSDNSMVLRVTMSRFGQFTSYDYTVVPKAGVDDALHIVPLARGMRGVTAQFELQGTQGADLSVDAVAVIPVELSRRG